MKQIELSQLTDHELLPEAKKMKKNAWLSAGLIGFMAGIIIYSLVANSIGFFTLIPLYFIYRMTKGPNNQQELKGLLKERNLQ